jgi:hypothetical protein
MIRKWQTGSVCIHLQWRVNYVAHTKLGLLTRLKSSKFNEDVRLKRADPNGKTPHFIITIDHGDERVA